jgi:N-acetylneuraminic acid mutarotase
MRDLASTEIFNPMQGGWHLAAPLPQTRFSHTASLLPDGRVLVVGGIVDGRISRSTLLYDSLHDRWESGPATHALHAGQSTVTLHDGRILIAAGYGGPAEIYNPGAASWSVAGMAPRCSQTIMLTLRDGTVLLASGISSTYHDLRSAHLYDPTTNRWTRAAPLRTRRDAAAAVLLPDGRVLVASGEQTTGHALRSAELYHPTSRSWSETAPLGTPRAGPTATLLGDGTVLVCGGANLYGVLATCELYHP